MTPTDLFKAKCFLAGDFIREGNFDHLIKGSNTDYEQMVFAKRIHSLAVRLMEGCDGLQEKDEETTSASPPTALRETLSGKGDGL